MACRVVDIPQRDRPRERLDRLGAGALTDAELVALIIRSGGRDSSAIEVAHDLIATHGSLHELASADLSGLKRCSTMGSAKASALIAAFELGRRKESSSPAASTRIMCSRDVAAIAAREIDDPRREQTLVLVLSTRGSLLGVRRLTTGTESKCLLDKRDVLRTVLSSGGSAFALAHNHPSGSTEPSTADVEATRETITAAEMVNVRFLDHVIVAGSKWTSIRERARL